MFVIFLDSLSPAEKLHGNVYHRLMPVVKQQVEESSTKAYNQDFVLYICPHKFQVFQTYKRLSWQPFTEQLLFVYSFFFLLRCARGEGKGKVPGVCYSRWPEKQAQITLSYYSPLFLDFKRHSDLLNFCPGYSHKHKSPTSKRLDELLLFKFAVQYTRYLSETDCMTWLIIQNVLSLS